MTRHALDTSVAVPLLLGPHPAHDAVMRWRKGRTVVLSGHAEIETYSVLTRLPGDLRLDAGSAFSVLRTGFADPVRPRPDLPIAARIAEAEVTGGAVYDALVALAALDAGIPLVTRDARAVPTYRRIGVEVTVI